MMPEQSAPSVTLSVDMKKYRIRIYKATLHKLGDPPYLQLLINPTTAVFALKAVEQESANDQTHRVSKKMLKSANSIEIYSRFFIDKLKELYPDLNDGRCLLSHDRQHCALEGYGSLFIQNAMPVFRR